jgi:hypothetical protein
MQAGISPSLQKQIEELSKRDINDNSIKKQAQRGMLIVHGSIVPTSLFCDVIEKNNLIQVILFFAICISTPCTI